jgi:hypothetical protein
VASNRLDDVSLELVRAFDSQEIDSVVVRRSGDNIAVICMDTKAALELMKRAIAELTAPIEATIQ